MEDLLDLAGVVLGFIGAVVLAVCAPASLVRLPNGHVAMHDGNMSDAAGRRAYRLQKYGTPAGWFILVCAFALQLAAKACKLLLGA